MKLFDLQPIGVGTSEAESLSSYIHRLCVVHGVSVGQMLGRVARLAGRNHASYEKYPALTIFVRPNETTLDLVRDLEKATNQQDLAALTMLPTMTCLARDMNCYEKDMRWCPACFSDQIAFGGETYYKLIWHFSDVQFCHLHGQRLERSCPDCATHQNTFKVRSDAFRCQICQSLLSSPNAPSAAAVSSWQNEAFDLCELVKDLRTYSRRPLDPLAPVRFIDSVFDYYWTSERELELYSRVDQHELLSVIDGRTPVTLRVLRKFAYRLGLPLDRFLRGGHVPYEQPLDLKNTYTPTYLQTQRRERRNHEAVLKKIKAIVDKNRPGLSLRQLANESGVSVGYIAHRLPGLKKKVVEDWKLFQAQEKARKRRLALSAAFEYLVRDERLFAISRKQALRVLMKETGLPKNVLRDAIRVAFEQSGVSLRVAPRCKPTRSASQAARPS